MGRIHATEPTNLLRFLDSLEFHHPVLRIHEETDVLHGLQSRAFVPRFTDDRLWPVVHRLGDGGGSVP